MAWVGNTKICLGFATEYALMDVETDQLTELFAPSGIAEAGPMSTLNSLYNMSIGSRGGKPMVTKIPNNEMLLARDSKYIFQRMLRIWGMLIGHCCYRCQYLSWIGWNAHTESWD